MTNLTQEAQRVFPPGAMTEVTVSFDSAASFQEMEALYEDITPADPTKEKPYWQISPYENKDPGVVDVDYNVPSEEHWEEFLRRARENPHVKAVIALASYSDYQREVAHVLAQRDDYVPSAYTTYKNDYTVVIGPIPTITLS